MADIFLSYRRQDSQSATGRLADHLDAHFGAARVFRDHDSIVAGEDFAAAIRRSVEVATVLLVVVGPRWLGASDSAGRRRLDDAHDFVRLEIELALAGDVAVVPVLVEDATMPSEADLPPSLAGFSRCQAVELSETRWRYDADSLVATLQSRFAIESDAAALATEGSGNERAARLATDLLDLAVHPRRLIARRQTGRASDHVRAFAFLATAILVGNIALVVGLDVHVARGASLALGAISFASWLIVGELVGLIVAGLLAVVLALAWRLVGGGVAYRRVGVVAGYVYGGAWIGFCAGALILGAAVQLVDPTLFDRIVASLQAASSGAAHVPSVPDFGLFQSAPFRGPATVLILVAFVIWVVAAGWCVVAWGAFRQAFAATRWQAAAATTIWLGVLLGLVALGQRLS